MEARCGVCATAKARVHPAGAAFRVPEWLVALAVLVVTLAVLTAL